MTRDDIPESERTRVEVYSRVMGYHRPVSFWNVGKQQEFRDRRMFHEEAVLTDNLIGFGIG